MQNSVISPFCFKYNGYEFKSKSKCPFLHFLSRKQQTSCYMFSIQFIFISSWFCLTWSDMLREEYPFLAHQPLGLGWAYAIVCRLSTIHKKCFSSLNSYQISILFGFFELARACANFRNFNY